jgi:transcriptional regulator with XRE-family HTH domain
MSRRHQMARLLRAVTELSQDEFAKATDLSPHLIAQIEAGLMEPSPPHLQKMARKLGITASDVDEWLRYLETLRSYRDGQQRGTQEAFPALQDHLETVLSGVYRHLLALPKPSQMPHDNDRLQAEALLAELRDASREVRVALIEVAEEYQNWALCELVCDESIKEAARNIEEATAWARLARQIAEGWMIPDDLKKRLQGYAGFFWANILRVAEDYEGAERAFSEAEQLWDAGSDPQGLLDPARRLDLKASLRRAQRRFDEALALLEEAVPLSQDPARVLVNKGFTLEVMGEYSRAVETLLLALALMEIEEDSRLRDITRLNLAKNFCHLGQYRNAAELIRIVQPNVEARGDEIDLTRIIWLKGSIEAGLGRATEGLKLLAQARERFAAENLFYDVALCLLEEAVILLGQGQIGRVKELAQSLTLVFQTKGIHREALAALRLFHEAAQRQNATAELARDLLRYLFRARHDEGLRFSPS